MSIYPDKKNGKLTGRFVVEVERQGRRLKKRCGTYAEAQQIERQLAAVAKMPQVANSDSGIEIAVGYARTDLRARSKPTTLVEALRASCVDLWRNPEHRRTQCASVEEIAALLGATKALRSITTEDTDRMVRKLREGGNSDPTLNRKLSGLRIVLKWCLKRRYIADLPELPFYEEEEGRIRWLTEAEEAEVDRLLRSYATEKASETFLRRWSPAHALLVADYVTVAVDTGMRRGEMLSLEPKQIEKGWVHLWKTKSKTPRSIPLTPRVEAILERLKGQGVFQGLQKHTLRWYWNRVRADMGLTGDEDFVVHTLRHTCATRMIAEKGIDVFTAAKWLGHKNLETTQRYCHINDEALLRARDRLLGYTHQNFHLGAGTARGA